MKSQLVTIVERLNKLIEEDNPKATYNFEKDGQVEASVSYDSEEDLFSVKYPGQKSPSQFDSIDMIAIEIFDILFE